MLDAFRYPLSGDARYRTLVAGVLLSALGVLVLPAVFVAGYYGRVLAASSTGRCEPPRFDGFGALFVQGLKTWAVVAIYLLLGVSVVVAVGIAALVLGEMGTGAGTWVGLLALVLAVLVLLGVFMIPAWFFFPAVMIHVARNDSVAAAFDGRAIADVVTDRRYLKAWAGGVAVLLIGSVVYALTGGFAGLVASMVVSAPSASGTSLGGHVIGVAVNFYCQVVAFHLFGRGYGAAIEEDDPRSESTPDTVPEYDGWGAEARAWRERRRRERNERTR